MNFPLSPKDDSKMRAAFEMNLDVAASAAPTTPETPKSFFKMLVSPKFSRKTPSPSVSVTPPTPTGPVAAATKKTPDVLYPPTPKMQKTLLGSPRLHRAIFGASRDKKKKLEASLVISEENGGGGGHRPGSGGSWISRRTGPGFTRPPAAARRRGRGIARRGPRATCYRRDPRTRRPCVGHRRSSWVRRRPCCRTSRAPGGARRTRGIGRRG